MKWNKFTYPVILLMVSVIVILLTTYLRPDMENVNPHYDNYDRFGLAAAWEYIDNSFYEGVLLEKKYDTLTDSGLIIIALSSDRFIKEEEGEELVKWLEKGNNAIILSRAAITTGESDRYSRQYDSNLERSLGIFPKNIGYNVKYTQKCTPILGGPYSTEEFPVEFRHWYDKIMESYGGKLVPIYSKKEDPSWGVIFEGRFKKGRILYMPSPYPFTNEGLRIENNAKFFLNVLRELAVDNRVIFDYYHQTFTGDDFVLSRMQRRRIWYMILIFFSAFLLLLISGYSRFGPVYSLEPEKRISVKSYILSLGDLYRRSAKGKKVAEDLYDMFLKALCRRFGIKYSTNTRLIIDAMELRSREFHKLLMKTDDLMKELRAHYTDKKLHEFEKAVHAAARAMGIER